MSENTIAMPDQYSSPLITVPCISKQPTFEGQESVCIFSSVTATMASDEGLQTPWCIIQLIAAILTVSCKLAASSSQMVMQNARFGNHFGLLKQLFLAWSCRPKSTHSHSLVIVLGACIFSFKFYETTMTVKPKWIPDILKRLRQGFGFKSFNEFLCLLIYSIDWLFKMFCNLVK